MKDSKNTGQGGGRGRLEKFQTEADFFFGWLPLSCHLLSSLPVDLVRVLSSFLVISSCIVDVLDGALDLLLEPVLVVGRLGVVPLDTEGVVKQGGELLGFHLLHKYKRCYFDKSSSPVSTNSNLLK